MNRLQTALHRLYLAQPAHAEDDTQASALIDSSSRVRALVMELTRPPSWALLSTVWQGVQVELELPAPGIAVSGTDGLQLWFSLAEPVTASQAHGFLNALRMRFLPDTEPKRVRLMPAADASALHPERHAQLVPALQEQTGNWSAFVAADLAPVFVDTPWLDIPPNEEGQATLLRALVSPETTPAEQDPRRFLQRVMNDDSVALALRIEAAKALLQHSDGQRPVD
jgi:hypothetical protein